jgi:OOP family OmpA-OmpF porin
MMTRVFVFLIFFQFVFFVSVGQSVNKNDLDSLVSKLNTRYDEQNPVLSPDGTKLYFTRANDSLNIGGTRDKGDIWMSELGEDGIWDSPINLGEPVNNQLKNYLLGFSPDGKIMFLNNEKELPGGIVINDGVFFSVNNGGKWSKPARVSVDYLLNRSKHQSGSISADGNLMLLSLQSYASRGEEDIYISTYKDGKWTQPVNLGSEINTSHQEMTPYLSPDQKSLYFSSNGHGGRGGRDIFVSERKGEGWSVWSRPKNLGSEVNSLGVELNYYMDIRNNIAYFSSTQNSDGYGDIKAHNINIQIQEQPEAEQEFEELVEVAEEARRTLTFSGTATNAKTNEGIIAAINLSNADFEVNVNSDEKSGLFTVEMPLNTSIVEVSIKAPGFMSINETLTPEGKDIDRKFELTPLEVGETFRLNKVYFQRGTPNLLEDSFTELDQVIDMMDENPNVKIELSGHTDNQGSSKLNLKLSQDRVDIVKQYLTEHGIDGKRIKGKGYGGTRPVASNASEETRKLNRRVEITILKNK